MTDRIRTDFIAPLCDTCRKPFVRRKGEKYHCSVQCRFWPKVDRRGLDECWPWKLRPNPNGYGKFKYDGEQLAHRVANFLATGVRPGEAVRHTCDNPPCCNPAHLVDGTQFENIADRDAKGRTGTRPKGEKNHNARLTAVAVGSIKRDPRGHAELARLHGVSAHAIWSIKHGKTWAHVDAS